MTEMAVVMVIETMVTITLNKTKVVAIVVVTMVAETIIVMMAVGGSSGHRGDDD